MGTINPRGIRNHNPGNIRRSDDDWEGLAPVQRDDSFFQFVNPVYGIRAMARILDSYRNRGVDTIKEIISTWAPASENNTAAYVASVVSQTGIGENQYVTRADYADLIEAIIRHENGQQPYSRQLINQAIAMA